MTDPVAVFPGTDPRLARCLRIRRTVFIEEQSVPEPVDVDGQDPRCTHFLLSNGRVDLATARLRLLRDGEQWIGKAERVAVLSRARGQGLGRTVMRALEDAAWKAGVSTVKLGAQLTAMPFYEQLGYVAYGPEFSDGGIPHRMMKKAGACSARS